MKRKAIEPPEEVLDGSKAKRARLGNVNAAHDDSDYDPNADGIFSDDESHSAVTLPTLPANDTPLTPLSPARKFPSDLKTIKCTFPGCEKTFNRPARLAAHIRSHNKERPFKCSYPGCDKDYMEEKHLKQHIKGSHTSEREHVCTHPNCGKSFMTATRLRRHQAVHEGQERFKCRDYPPCEQSFRKHQTLQRHILSEHLHLSPFPCDYKDGVSGDVCGAGFDNAGALRRHQEKEHGEIRFWCDECSSQQDNDDPSQQKRVGFTTMALLQAHMKQAHVNCMFCGLQCNGRSDLEQHMEAHHSNPKSLEERKTVPCTYPGCTKTFTKKSNLNVHIRSFHEGLRFVCGDVDLSSTEDLAGYSQADGCGEGFVTKANLENHVRYVHLRYERPEQTQGAAKAKQQTSNLLDELTGAGENSRRTLPCTITGCTAKFPHNGELQAHLQNEHPIEQALMEGVVGRASIQMMAEPPVGFADMMQGIVNWEEQTGNEQFWVGGEDPNEGNPATQGLEQEWVNEESEMRQLIDDTYPLEPLRGYPDSALNDYQFQ
ncbi:hypothetical protein F5Y05DRAFT_362573 [Hypoxylon sp. FL0543]|nr:hypothetical protein F5Y05DRAFT_362573 [Hypoxylon sp. FL0543]